MFGDGKVFGNKKQLEELLNSLAVIDKMMDAVQERRNETVASDKDTDKQLKRIFDELKELKSEVEKLVSQFDSELVEEVKSYLGKDIDRLINEQNNLYATIETHIKNSFLLLEARFGDLDKRVDSIYEEMKEVGINIVKDVVPGLIESKIQEEIYKVIRAYLEINIFNKAKNDFDKKLREQGKTLSDREKEVYYEEIKKNVVNVVNIIMNEIELKNSKREEEKKKERIIKPFDRDAELVHENFDKLRTCVEAGIIPMLVGPAGTGKSTAVEQVARAMGLPFYTMNRIQNSFDLTGYNDANGRYVSTQFYEAYTKGGIFFFDEIDASSPEALVTINTALAQGYMAFPNGLVKMHPDFKVVAAGNTYGKGANRQYCGRNSLDSATLDRFMIIEWDYDRKLEAKIIKDKELLEFAWAVRDSIELNRLQIIISTRGIKATSKIIEASAEKEGFSLVESLEGNLFENVRVDTLYKIIGDLESKKGMESNKYFKALVELKNKLENNKR